MSMIFHKTKKCAVCGKDSKYPVLASTNAFGACDLDLRPPDMKRSTMSTWVEECYYCGYVSHDITKLPDGAPDKNEVDDFICRMDYIFAEKRGFESELAVKLYKHYMLNKGFGNNRKAFNSLLWTAWACDDANDKDNAVYCRELATEYLDILISEDPDDKNLIVQKADILRRSGHFDAVIKEYEGKALGNELLDKIIAFQIEKAKLGDDACYTVADVE